MLAYVDGEEVVSECCARLGVRGSAVLLTPDRPSVNKGDSAWILIAFALVFSMAPGVGFLYSGLLRRKNALSVRRDRVQSIQSPIHSPVLHLQMLFLALMVFSVIQVEWVRLGVLASRPRRLHLVAAPAARLVPLEAGVQRYEG